MLSMFFSVHHPPALPELLLERVDNPRLAVAYSPRRGGGLAFGDDNYEPDAAEEQGIPKCFRDRSSGYVLFVPVGRMTFFPACRAKSRSLPSLRPALSPN